LSDDLVYDGAGSEFTGNLINVVLQGVAAQNSDLEALLRDPGIPERTEKPPKIDALGCPYSLAHTNV
jgi:hypothetical protein